MATEVPVTLSPATVRDAAAVAGLLSAAADTLTVQYGTGHWTRRSSDRGVLQLMRTGLVFVAAADGRPVATLTLTPKKPWAIDVAYFQKVARPLYLLSMAVAPDMQGRGIGRQCVQQAVALCREWPADAIRLDAYDAAAGAGPFYAKCGFREVGHVVYRKVPLTYFEMVV